MTTSALPLLYRHFRERFLAGEGASESEGPEVTAVHVAACLGGPGVVVPFLLWIKYLRLSAVPLDVVIRSSWWDRAFFLTWSMAITGFVTLLLWGELFPDETDYHNLLPLPIRVSEIFVAKLAVVFLLLAGFFAATNGISGVMFPIFEGFSMPGGIRLVTAHALALLAGSLWVFFTLAGAQGVLTAVLPASVFRRVSAAFQTLAVVALLLMLLGFSAIARHFADGDASASLPPVWFLGLYDRALGGTGSDRLAARALLALGAAFAAFVAGYAASYRRFVRRTLETSRPSEAGPARTGRMLELLLSRVLARDPAVRALFDFSVRTLGRSRRHRLFMAGFAGAGLAIALQGGLVSPPGVPDPATLAIPLVLTFFLAVGLRVVAEVPVEFPAQWVFRVAGNARPERALEGARRAFLLLAVLPPALLVFPSAAFSWGAAAAFRQLIYDVALGALLVEALFVGFRKVPFAASYVSGGANLKVTILPWLAAFLAYAYAMARLEEFLLPRPRAFVFFVAAATLSMVALARARRRFVRRDGLSFEDPPDTPSMGLDG